MTNKEYKSEFKEIKEFFDLKHLGTITNKNTLVTAWGTYNFWFDNDSIFGRFESLKNEALPERYPVVKGTTYQVTHYPNVHSGKMNFHYADVFDFIDTLDRIVI